MSVLEWREEDVMKLLLFHGTVRKGQYTRYVTEFVKEVALQRDGVAVTVVDPAELDITFETEGNRERLFPKLTKQVTEADAYIIVAPEYNHSFPGSLKYVLDLHLKEYIHKPVALVGVSSGPFGGTRMIESLVNVVRELGMVATFSDMPVSMVKEEFADGKVNDKAKWEKRANTMLDELLWMAEVLRYGRENIASRYHTSSS